MTRKVSFANTGIATDIMPITPNDSTDNVDANAIGLYVTAGGAITMNTAKGSDRVITVGSNTYHYISVKRIKSTGTTATGIHALVV